MKNQRTKRYNKKSNPNLAKFTYFGCGKQGHMKMDCSSLINKEKTNEKKDYVSTFTRLMI